MAKERWHVIPCFEGPAQKALGEVCDAVSEAYYAARNDDDDDAVAAIAADADADTVAA